jgi:hypothetical protein
LTIDLYLDATHIPNSFIRLNDQYAFRRMFLRQRPVRGQGRQ